MSNAAQEEKNQVMGVREMDYPIHERPMCERMRTVADWLASRFDKSVSVAQAADRAVMSERNFLRHFTREIGTTPSEYLIRVRFARACSMLVDTGLPAKSIAVRCGLGDGGHLCKLFRKRLHTTPREFRRQHTSHAS